MIAGLAILAIVIASTAIAAEPEILTGKVVAVANGDMLTLLVGRQQLRIRLEGLWADPSPLPPWEFRARQRSQPSSSADTPRASIDGPATGAGYCLDMATA
jgi:hypothetical protein